MDTISLDSRKSSLRFTSKSHGHQNGHQNDRSAYPVGLILTTLGCVFIAMVSIHDTYLVTIEEEILNMEKNPICARLIQWEPVGFTYFILGKMIGTLSVILAIIALHCSAYRHAGIITGAVVAFQFSLLVYLHLSDPLLGGLPNFAILFNGSM